MEIYAPLIARTFEYTYPAAIDASTETVTLEHEWGGTIATATPSLVSGTTYNVTIDAVDLESSGVHILTWGADIGGVAFDDSTSFLIRREYIDSDTFFDRHPELEDYANDWDLYLSMAHIIIDNFCGQDFQYVTGQQRELRGTCNRNVYTEQRIVSFTEVLVDTTDYTTSFEIDRTDNHFIRTIKQVDPAAYSDITDVGDGAEVLVTGDWGWRFVPRDVENAADLLIVDLMEDIRRENYRYGIVKQWQDTNRLDFANIGFESTGNLDVDVMLMDYVRFQMDLFR